MGMEPREESGENTGSDGETNNGDQPVNPQSQGVTRSALRVNPSSQNRNRSSRLRGSLYSRLVNSRRVPPSRPQFPVLSAEENVSVTAPETSNILELPISPFDLPITEFELPVDMIGLSKKQIEDSTITCRFQPVKGTCPAQNKINTNHGEMTKEESGSLEQADSSENCVVCQHEFVPNAELRRLPCLHMFHRKCIDEWLITSKKCPVCRVTALVDYERLMTNLRAGHTINQCVTENEANIPTQPLINPVNFFAGFVAVANRLRTQRESQRE